MTHNHGSHHHGEDHECECGGDCQHEHEGHTHGDIAIVESAKPLSEKEKSSLAELVVKIAGQITAVDFKVNAALLGGFTIQIGDRKLDVSLKSELSQLTQTLKGKTHGK